MRNFVTMVKPVGSFCNMSCSYCYYLHADNQQDMKEIRMSDAVLEKYIRSMIEAVEGDVVSFTWHGGEPTLAGLDFYQKAMALQKKYCPQNKTIWNNMQTNGLLIDEAWCKFIKENHFDVGLSIDGTRFVHDQYRNDAGGNDTYQRVQKTLLLFQKYGIQPDLLCTVTDATAENAKAVYTALRSFHTGWIQFIPIVRRDENGKVTEDSVKPEAYGRFLKSVFKEWVTKDLGKLNVQLFAETALVLSGKKANVCWLSETCGNVIVVEKNGNVYSCDHFVDRNHLLGNLTEDPLEILVDSQRQILFGKEKANVSQRCRQCPWLDICHGGCPKDRFLIEDEEKQYYLCEGMKMYLDYAVPVLKEAMRLSSKGFSSPEIMKVLKKTV